MLNKKAAIGLAMNTIVVVVISIVILTSGIFLLRGWMEGAEDLKTQLDERTQSELERLLIDQGKKVALPLHTATLQAGEDHVFGLGILNIDKDQYGDSFSVDISLSKLLDEDTGDDISGTISDIDWVLYESEGITIYENEHYSLPILVDVPVDSPKGVYIFNLEVYYSGSILYDNIKKFYVTVT